jgi:hypothetical protein
LASRKETLEGYRFAVDRVQRAALTGDPESTDSNYRQLSLALFVGLMVGIIVAAGVAINGLLRTRVGSDWKQHNSLVIVAETGDRYLYLDGRLRPVANLASARLALYGSADHPTVVPVQQLSGVPRGPRIGIDGAPDLLPDDVALARPPWTICDTATQTEPAVSLVLGQRQDGGVAVTDRALVVQATGPDGGLVALWHGRRFAFPADTTKAALGLTAQPPLRVDSVTLALIAPGDPTDLSGAALTVGPAGARTLCVVWDPVAPAQWYISTTSPTGPDHPGTPKLRIIVDAGRGALIQATGDATPAIKGRRYLITEQGVRYELVSNGAVDAAAALGFSGVRATPVPGELVSLIPSGPALDPDALGG